MTRDDLVGLLIAAASVAVATWFFYCLAGMDPPGPCDIDAPMEASQCRAEGRAVARGIWEDENHE
jgi:hypothetical protein